MPDQDTEQRYRVVMRAQYTSACSRCPEPIQAGTQMVIIPGLGNHHSACAPRGLPGEVMRRGSGPSPRIAKADLREQRTRVANRDNQERYTL